MSIPCERKEKDYFIVETMPDEGSDITVADLLAQGLECYLLFSKDGTVGFRMFSDYKLATWKDNVITFTKGDQSADFGFSLEDDVLTIDFSAGEMTFRRSDAEPPEPPPPEDE